MQGGGCENGKVKSPAILAAAFVACAAAPVAAETYVYEYVVEEWVDTGSARFVPAALAEAERAAIAAYGPFRVLDDSRAALVGTTDSYSPAEFAAMMAAYPHIATLEFVECPGTLDDRANLRLGRLIRAHGLATSVPEGGSVRSGAVELFLAGSTRRIADGAEFAVHAWLDDLGRSARDYAPDSPEHTKYLSYYREMGMDEGEARAFYAMTNSVPFEDARWLTGSEMRGWVSGGQGTLEPLPLPPQPVIAQASPQPRLAYAELAP